jgi:hypothetical protein
MGSLKLGVGQDLLGKPTTSNRHPVSRGRGNPSSGYRCLEQLLEQRRGCPACCLGLTQTPDMKPLLALWAIPLWVKNGTVDLLADTVQIHSLGILVKIHK